MRAKMRITNIETHNSQSETLYFCGVSKDGPYPSDGSDEDNTFAKFSPQLNLTLRVANPALVGKFKSGDTFYVDFTKL
jgi:hypothetical protein